MAQSTKTDEKHLPLDAGLQAFRDALAPQEGQFMRGVSVVLNDPKDLPFKPSRGGTDVKSTQTLGMPSTDAEKVAARLCERNAKGQFVSAECDKTDPLWKV